MYAPLVYCAKKRGYRYEKEYVLPSFFLSEGEKEIVRLLAEQNRTLGTFGYGKYKGQADILSKISTSEIDKNRTMIKEPYFAEIEMVGGRTSTVPLDYFLCGKAEGEKYTYAFF